MTASISFSISERVDNHRIHNGDVVGDHHILEDAFVHANGGTNNTCAHIGNICQFEQSLHRSIFAECPMQDGEEDIDVSRDLRAFRI